MVWDQVQLGAHKHNVSGPGCGYEFRILIVAVPFTDRVSQKIFNLILEALKSPSLGDVVNSQAGITVAEVGLGHRPKALLASCVPDLQLNEPVIDLQSFDFEIHTDGNSVVWIENIVRKSEQQRSLATSTVSNHHNFVQSLQVLLPHAFKVLSYPCPYSLFSLFSGHNHLRVYVSEVNNFFHRIQQAQPLMAFLL